LVDLDAGFALRAAAPLTRLTVDFVRASAADAFFFAPDFPEFFFSAMMYPFFLWFYL
jgi:hypothetical protein